MLGGGSLEDAFFAATKAATKAGFDKVLETNPMFYGTDKSIKSVLNSVTDNVILKLTGNIDLLSAGTGNGVGYNDATQRNSQNEIEHLTEDAVGEIASIFFENILGGDGVVDEEAKFFEAFFDDPFSAFEDEFFFAEESFFGPDIFGPVNFFFNEGPKDEFLFFFDEGPDDFIPDEFDFSGVTIIGGDGDDQIDGGDLKVTTTLTEDGMRAAQEGVLEAKPEGFGDKQLHAASASVEVGTGRLLGFYAGQDYLDSQINWAVSGGMVGSTMKPFTLAAAIDAGFSLRDTFAGNSPFVFPDGLEVRNAGGGDGQDFGERVNERVNESGFEVRPRERIFLEQGRAVEISVVHERCDMRSGRNSQGCFEQTPKHD